MSIEQISASTWGTKMNPLQGTTDSASNNIHNIIWPVRNFEEIIASFSEETPEPREWETKIYVLTKEATRQFEKTLWNDLLPVDGKVILVLEDTDSTHTQIFVCDQDTADRYMEWRSYGTYHHYFSLQYPNWFYPDREEE